MNKSILKQFTFGFEIEGNFAQNLTDKLNGNFKEDGSVGSDERIRLPSDFEPYNLEGNDGFDGDTCSTCEGNGQYNEDCECEGSTRCEHPHQLECYTESLKEECERRFPNINLLSALHNRYAADNCDHNCRESGCLITYECENDNDHHLVDCNNCDGTGSVSGSGLAQEYASKKFTKIEDMLKELAMFKSEKRKPTHIWNRTCGLHLHIGKKPTNKISYKQIWNATANMDFLRTLYEQAGNWCTCQRKRLFRDDDHYYAMFKNPIDLIETYQHQYPLRTWRNEGPNEKFRFLRFHEDFKTLEFRFLSPCEHKVGNVERLISSLTDYLGSSNIYKSDAKVTDKPISEKIGISIPVHKKGYFLNNANLDYHLKHYPHALSEVSMFTERTI